MNTNILNIVGKGFLGKKFKKFNTFLKDNKFYIYASGVSNSNEKNLYNLKRDFIKVQNFIAENKLIKIVYISTCSIFDPNRNKSLYIKNKIKIEKLIKKKSKNYLIIRLPEIVGKNNNKNTLTNFFYNNIKISKKFTLLFYAKRNILDVDDAVKLIIYFLKKKITSRTINIANLNYYRPIKIVNIIENILKKKGNYSISFKKLKRWKINNSLNSEILKKSKIKFKKNYLLNIIKKYYK